MANHTSFLSCFLPTLIFSLISGFLFLKGWIFLGFIFNVVIIFSILRGFSLKLWQQEIQALEWDRKFSPFRQPSQKYIKKPWN